jgi:hypothetical protein
MYTPFESIPAVGQKTVVLFVRRAVIDVDIIHLIPYPSQMPATLTWLRLIASFGLVQLLLSKYSLRGGGR